MLYYADISDLKSVNIDLLQVMYDNKWDNDQCSAFVKVTENNEDILVGHNTWFK